MAWRTVARQSGIRHGKLTFQDLTPEVPEDTMNEISIYQTENGAIEVRIEQDTVLLSQEQMA